MAVVKVYKCDGCSKLVEPDERTIVIMNGDSIKRQAFDMCLTCIRKVTALLPTFQED